MTESSAAYLDRKKKKEWEGIGGLPDFEGATNSVHKT